MSPETPPEWGPIPDRAAQLLGRLVFYSSWLDDTLGEAVVLGTLPRTDDAKTTPGWADSGKRLVAAVRRVQLPDFLTDKFADRLDKLNGIRNQLVHGRWQWDTEEVGVWKRSLDGGPRTYDWATYSYDEIEKFIEEYRAVGALASRLVDILEKGQPRFEA